MGLLTFLIILLLFLLHYFSNKLITIQLDESNYLLWKQHVFFMIEGHSLEKHIDGSLVLDLAQGDYASLKKQDWALASWLLASISLNILSSLIRCTFACDIWTMLQ